MSARHRFPLQRCHPRPPPPGLHVLDVFPSDAASHRLSGLAKGESYELHAKSEILKVFFHFPSKRQSLIIETMMRVELLTYQLKKNNNFLDALGQREGKVVEG